MSLRRIIVFLIVLMATSQSFAVMKFIYHAPESANDTRYQYHWEVLRTALDLTSKKYGPFTMTAGSVMSEERQLAEIKKSSPARTVMIRETNEIYENFLTPVRIPVDRNLIGYRVLLIDKKTQPELLKVKTLEDLKKYSVGQGSAWGDIAILEYSGLLVKIESHYDDLFKALVNGKFKIFPRGVVEIQDEYRHFKGAHPSLAIESQLLVYYPLPTYFWFHKTDNGRKMAERVNEGLSLMIRSGSLQKIFDKHYAKVIQELDLKHRTIIKIPNPYLPSTVPFEQTELWYKPEGETELPKNR